MKLKNLALNLTNIWHPIKQIPDLNAEVILIANPMICFPLVKEDKTFEKKLEKTITNKHEYFLCLYGHVAKHKKHGLIFISDIYIRGGVSIVKNKLWCKYDNLINDSDSKYPKWAYVDEIVYATDGI